MNSSLHPFAAEAYGSRAPDYVASAVHSAGPDLDQIEAALVGHETARVLDLGCGGGHVSYRAAPHVAEVAAVDVTAAMLEAVWRTAQERGLANITTHLAAAENLPFADASFDAVLCRFTAHHWDDLEMGLRQARRVLCPGGFAIFIDSVAPPHPALDSHLQAVELLRDPSHVRNYSLAEWTASMSRAGLFVDRVTMRKLRMEFPVWTARTRTPAVNANAIRAVQLGAPGLVAEHFAIGPDGSFDLDVAAITVRA